MPYTEDLATANATSRDRENQPSMISSKTIRFSRSRVTRVSWRFGLHLPPDARWEAAACRNGSSLSIGRLPVTAVWS